MRLASGNPAVFQDTIEESSEGEAAQQEPEHGEDTIARVKGGNILHFYIYMHISQNNMVNIASVCQKIYSNNAWRGEPYFHPDFSVSVLPSQDRGGG